MLRKAACLVFVRRSSILHSNVHRNFVALSSADSRSANLRNSINKYCSNTAAQSVAVVDYKEVKGLPNKSNVVLVDVREPKEIQETGKIPTSINIPLGNVTEELGPGIISSKFQQKYGCEKPEKSTHLIFYCKIGRRSLKAAETALALGYKNVKNYEGSWTDWAEKEGLPK